jgi:hypothetical protein
VLVGDTQWSWAFALSEVAPGRTRLVVRSRGAGAPPGT